MFGFAFHLWSFARQLWDHQGMKHNSWTHVSACKLDHPILSLYIPTHEKLEMLIFHFWFLMLEFWLWSFQFQMFDCHFDFQCLIFDLVFHLWSFVRSKPGMKHNTWTHVSVGKLDHLICHIQMNTCERCKLDHPILSWQIPSHEKLELLIFQFFDFRS